MQPMPRAFVTAAACAVLVYSLHARAAGEGLASGMDARHWQLFIDDFAVARATGLDRVVHHPRPMGVVIPADKPWETCDVSPDFVARRNDGTFVAIYRAGSVTEAALRAEIERWDAGHVPTCGLFEVAHAPPHHEQHGAPTQEQTGHKVGQ